LFQILAHAQFPVKI